jgi:hypothetical protein
MTIKTENLWFFFCIIIYKYEVSFIYILHICKQIF